jgi:hypothetical protein
MRSKTTRMDIQCGEETERIERIKERKRKRKKNKHKGKSTIFLSDQTELQRMR